MYFVQTALICIFFLFLAGLYFDNVDPRGYGKACLLFLVLTIAVVLPLSIFAGVFGGLRLRLRSWGFLKPGFLGLIFWFLGPGILDWRGLNIEISSYKMVVLGTILISLTSIVAKSERGLGLELNRVFNHLIKVIELLATLFYFYTY